MPGLVLSGGPSSGDIYALVVVGYSQSLREKLNQTQKGLTSLFLERNSSLSVCVSLSFSLVNGAVFKYAVLMGQCQSMVC